MDFKKSLSQKIVTIIPIDETEAYNLIEIPKNKLMGDFSFPCFKLSKEVKKSPNSIANDLAVSLKEIKFIDDIKVEGAYLNFYVNKKYFAHQVIQEVIDKGDKYGKSTMGNGKNIVIDFSSPNIAKPFHVGHLRSTVIGNSLYNIFNFLGYKSIGINHLGDWGTQFGKLIVAYKNWSNKEEVEKHGIKELNRVYVKFHEEVEKLPHLNEEARGWLIKMQESDEEAITLWKFFNDISMIEFESVYKRLNISFDHYTGESFYNDKMDVVVQELEDKSILVESNGAKIVDLEKYNMPPCLILRSDGGTLYPTRDLAAAMFRMKEYNFEKCLYVTAIDQSMHFAQWFKVIEVMGLSWSEGLVHIPFGLVSLETGKLSTRKGNVVLMNEILNEAVNKTKEIINEKNPNLKNKDKVAEDVGIGAIIFNDLYNSRIKDVVFSWDKMLNFEGETGPYVQYTHARACSLLTKGGDIDFINIDFSVLTDESSIELIKLIYHYPDKIIEASIKYEPFVISRHLVNISQAFNRFYHNNPIITSEARVKNARLALVYVTKNLINSGLNILGIKAPKEM